MGRFVDLLRWKFFMILLLLPTAGRIASASLMYRPAWSGYLTEEYRLDRPRVSTAVRDLGFSGFTQAQISEFGFFYSAAKGSDLDPNWIRAMRYRYEQRARLHWLDQRHQIHTFFEEQEYRNSQLAVMQDGLKEIRSNLSRVQLRKIRIRLRKRMNEEEDPVFNAAKVPIGGALFVTSIGLGQPVGFGLADRARLELRTQFLDQYETGLLRSGFLDAKVTLTSPWADTSIRLDTTAEEIRDPAKARGGDANQRAQHRKERLHFSLSRDIPYLDISGGFAYGTSSSLLTASLRKSLSPNLTCVVDTSTPVNEDRHPGESVERSVRFEYGIHF